LYAEWDLNLKLQVYASIQLAYIILFTLIRHFKKKKDLLLEWVNNIFYLSLIIILFMYNKFEDWNPLATDVFIYLIMGNNIVTFFINVCKAHI